MSTEDFYAILGVERTSSEQEVKKAYRKLARELHPDKNTGNKNAEERFKKVSAAYAVLGDKDKRKLYDKYGLDGLRDGFDPNQWGNFQRGYQGSWGPTNGQGQNHDFGGFSGFGALEDIFENLFGGQGRGGRRSAVDDWQRGRVGSQVKSVLEIDLMDAVLGKDLQIEIDVEGERRKLKIKIPKGVESGKSIRLKGQGGRGVGGGSSGDLLLEIVIKDDPKYERDGLNLKTNKRISFGTAYFGGSSGITTPWGDVKMTVPTGTQGGQVLRIRGKGIDNGEKTGDLHVKLQIEVPKIRNEEFDAAVTKIEEAYKKESEG